VSRTTLALCAHYFATFAALGVIFPFFPNWLSARRLSGLELSAIVALRPVLGVVGPLVSGLVADRLALRGSMLRLVSVGALAVMSGLAAISAFGIELAFWPLFCLVFAYAVFRSPMLTLADTVALEERASYGALRLWGSLGFMVAALTTGWFVDPEALAGLPIAVAVVLLVALLAALPLPVRAEHMPRPVWQDARRLAAGRVYATFLAVAVIWAAAHGCYNVTISLYLRDLGASPRFIGLCWALATLTEVALLAASGSLLRRVDARTLLVVGLLAGAVRWGLVSAIESLPVLLALQPLHALSFALVWVSAMDFVKRHAPAHILATGQGLFAAAMAGGSGIGILGWGTLYATLGGATVYRAAAVVALVGAMAAASLRSMRQPPS